MLTEISESLISFIENQKIFFVGTARNEGSVNVSPKGMDTFKIINSNKIVWLNLTGSGNETAAHLQENNRMTIMFCSFEEKPLILRLYGKAKIHHEDEIEFQENISFFPKHVGARQIIIMKVEKVQTSCGFAVPFMEFKKERSQLTRWADKKGENGIKKYWKDKNSTSIDGYDL